MVRAISRLRSSGFLLRGSEEHTTPEMPQQPVVLNLLCKNIPSFHISSLGLMLSICLGNKDLELSRLLGAKPLVPQQCAGSPAL